MFHEKEREFFVVKWLEALRSGNYLQGAGSLRIETEDGYSRYCCLGVLCDIVDNTKWNVPTNPENDAVEYQGISIKVSYPPEDIEEIYKDFVSSAELAQMNDSDDASFADIAEAIEVSFAAKYGRKPQLPEGTS